LAFPVNYVARFSSKTKTFRKIRQIDAFISSGMFCAPVDCQNSAHAAMKPLSTSRRFVSRDDRIFPPHPPRPLKQMLHRAAQKAALHNRARSASDSQHLRTNLSAINAKRRLKDCAGTTRPKLFTASCMPPLYLCGPVMSPNFLMARSGVRSAYFMCTEPLTLSLQLWSPVPSALIRVIGAGNWFFR